MIAADTYPEDSMPPATARPESGFARVREIGCADSIASLLRKLGPRRTRFTLHGYDIARLDRFVGQAQRTALRAGREFEGVSIEVDAESVVSVHAIGLTSMLL
jgi:hypothetical protein